MARGGAGRVGRRRRNLRGSPTLCCGAAQPALRDPRRRREIILEVRPARRFPGGAGPANRWPLLCCVLLP